MLRANKVRCSAYTDLLLSSNGDTVAGITPLNHLPDRLRDKNIAEAMKSIRFQKDIILERIQRKDVDVVAVSWRFYWEDGATTEVNVGTTENLTHLFSKRHHP